MLLVVLKEYIPSVLEKVYGVSSAHLGVNGTYFVAKIERNSAASVLFRKNWEAQK